MRFVVCGEALIDLIPDHAPGATAGKWTAYSGGGPFNTATALAKLGEDVHFLASIFHGGPVWGWSAPVASRLF